MAAPDGGACPGAQPGGCPEPLCYPATAMKTDIHPDYMMTKVHCSCGNEFITRSTKAEIKVEVCSNCHPFYTGKQKLMDSAGRVERFQKRLERTAAVTAPKGR